MMETTLTALVGGETEARMIFLNGLSETLEKLGEPINSEDCYKLGTLSWEHGFESCSHIILDAARRGELTLTLERGGVVFDLTPRKT